MFRYRFTCVAYLATVSVVTSLVLADTLDKKTTVTFSNQVEVPGTLLEPGTYVMRLVSLPSNLHVVQFLNDRENHVFAAAMTIPTHRPEAISDNKTRLAFYEAPAGEPSALRSWYYSSDDYGQEFVYPKVRALQLAGYSRPTSGAGATQRRNPQPGKFPNDNRISIAHVTSGHAPSLEPPQEIQTPTMPVNSRPDNGSALPIIVLLALGVMALAGAGAVRVIGTLRGTFGDANEKV